MKKLLTDIAVAVCLVGLLALPALAGQSESAPSAGIAALVPIAGEACYANGDANGDGLALSVADRNYLDNFINGANPPPAPIPLYSCDLNGDGYVNQADLHVYEEFFAFGLAAFDPYGGYPVPCPCDPGCCIGRAGNVDGDLEDFTDIGDLTALISYLFIPPFTPPFCMDEANTDGEGTVDIGDLTSLIGYLFIPPFTEPAVCQ